MSSEVGRGSTFVATVAAGIVPGSATVAASATDLIGGPAASHRTGEVALPGMRVLVVDDGDTNRKLLKVILQRAGAEVTTAENGQAGLTLAIQQPFDAILMDMQMPVMDGYEASRRIREHGLTVPIFALTAHAMRGDQEKCLAAGCSSYLSKPIDTQLLLERLAALGRAPDVIRPTAAIRDPQYREVVREFVDRLPDTLQQIRQAAETRDFNDLAARAHSLKGTGGSVGFPCLSEAAERLESAVGDRDQEAILKHLADLADLIDRIDVE